MRTAVLLIATAVLTSLTATVTVTAGASLGLDRDSRSVVVAHSISWD
ncbi:hypothetical protein [Streptomyces parvulus]